MGITGAAPTMPAIEYGSHLIEWLQDLRVVQQGDGRLLPVAFTELESWARMTGRRLTWWEAETLSKMSEAYATWSTRAIKADCPSPIDKTPEKSVSERIKDNFKSIDTKRLKRGDLKRG
jgi:hypothetical protein